MELARRTACALAMGSSIVLRAVCGAFRDRTVLWRSNGLLDSSDRLAEPVRNPAGWAAMPVCT